MLFLAKDKKKDIRIIHRRYPLASASYEPLELFTAPYQNSRKEEQKKKEEDPDGCEMVLEGRCCDMDMNFLPLCQHHQLSFDPICHLNINK